MCILFFAVNQHPNYPLILCANRDEFHQRPTKAMHWWQKPDLLAGKDLQANGSWLALNKKGDFAALTNYRKPVDDDQQKRSRGELVINAVTQGATEHLLSEQYLQQLAPNYNGFNLVYGKLDNLQCFDSINQKLTPITDGFHSVCNGALDDIWPKMALGVNQLSQEISQTIDNSSDIDIERLFALMQNSTQASDTELPKTGIPMAWEQLLSSIFIVSADYGTRSTTIITFDNNQKVNAFERNYNPQGQLTSKQQFNFAVKTD